MAVYPATGAGLTRIDDHRFSLPEMPDVVWSRRRGVQAVGTDGIPLEGIWVLSTTVADGRITVTTTGRALPNPLASVSMGQAVGNAPMLGADSDADNRHLLAGSGDWINPIIFNQIWS